MSEQQWLRQFVEHSIFSRHRAGGGTSTNGNDIGAVNGTLSDFDHFELVEAEARHISLSGGYLSQEVAMFKVSVVVFALAVSGFMLWIAHENTNFAQLPHATFIKRAV